MTKLYKILITITFIIALFFLVKYIISVIPRYETKEIIIEHSFCNIDNEYLTQCSSPVGNVIFERTDKGVDFIREGIYHDDVIDYYCKTATATICYIKYKQRIK